MAAENGTQHVVALSGGKDSTAMALRMREVMPDLDPVYLITPTGDELPDMVDHWLNLERLLGKPMERVTTHTLDSLIETFTALPNGKMRWCTRMIKIEPCLAFLARAAHEGTKPILYVGLRADEPERLGLYSDKVQTRFPMREWGWGIEHVRGYLREQGVRVPDRTDCARCYDQRLGEWHELWRNHPDIWADAEAQEEATGHTFRSATRDTWPAALKDMRAKFEAGSVPKGHKLQLLLFEDEAPERCRICRM